MKVEVNVIVKVNVTVQDKVKVKDGAASHQLTISARGITHVSDTGLAIPCDTWRHLATPGEVATDASVEREFAWIGAMG